MPTPGKNFPKEKGFPTPDNTPSETVRRVFTVPNSEQWLGLIEGAAQELLDEWRWYQWGSLTPEEAVDAWNDIILASYEEALDQSVPTPYWDEDDDLDDEETIADQTWYGEVADPSLVPDGTTFVENLQIWTFAGLLAIAGAPGAALSFITIAPKFVIAMRQHNVGNIIRVFVDAAQAAEVTDSGDGSVVEIPVVADPSLSTHQIYVTVGT